MTHHSPCIVILWENQQDQQGLIALFNVSQQNNSNQQFIQFKNLPDGIYENLLSKIDIKGIDQSSDSTINVSNNGQIPVPSIASVLFYSGFVLKPNMFYSELFDFDYKGM